MQESIDLSLFGEDALLTGLTNSINPQILQQNQQNDQALLEPRGRHRGVSKSMDFSRRQKILTRPFAFEDIQKVCGKKIDQIREQIMRRNEGFKPAFDSSNNPNGQVNSEQQSALHHLRNQHRHI